MAVSDQQIATWLAANPTATDAQIAAIAAAAGVSAEQLSRVTGVPVSTVVSRLNTASPTGTYTVPESAKASATTGYSPSEYNLSEVLATNEPKPYKDLYAALQSGKARLKPVSSVDDAGNEDVGYIVLDANGNPIEGVSVNPNNGLMTVPSAGGYIYVNTEIGKGGTLAPVTDYAKQVGYQGGTKGGFLREFAPIIGIGASLFGLPAFLGSTLVPTASLATQSLVGGSLVGAGTAKIAGSDPLKGALLGGATAYISGGGFKSPDVGMNSTLTPAQLESAIATPGYGYGAEAAKSGLFDTAAIGANAYTQTSYPADMAEFLAADAKNLYSQVGGNIPAIEQNLIASGVDPLVAADVANTVTLNPNISTYDLTNKINTTFGGSKLYDVNTATQYPTSVLPDQGGLLTNVPTTTPPATETPATTTTPATTKTPLNSTLVSAAAKILPGLLTAGAINQMANKPGVPGGIPTQGVPANSPEYYQAIQQYYNAYMPEQPRDVATPLQQWYDSKYGA